MPISLGIGVRPTQLGSISFSPLSLAPLAWWRLNDGSGSTAVDSSGNGYNLTLTNSPTWISGQVGGGLNFVAASTQKGETSASGLMTSLQNSSTFSIAFWARAASYQDNAAAFSIRNGTDVGAVFLFYPYDTQTGDGARIFWNGTSVVNQNAGAASLAAWHHFVFVSRSATDHECYVDNVSIGTDSTSLSNSGTLSHVDIGAWNGGQNFTGDMDEVMIFGRALTPAEITALYNWGG